MLKIAHLNIRSLLPKISNLNVFLQLHNIDVLTISETWLGPSITDCKININGYSLIRKDRDGRGGGVGAYIRRTISYSFIQVNEGVTEQLWFVLHISAVNVAVGCVYKSPDLDYRQFLNEIANSFSIVLSMSEYVSCLGDFNIDLLNSRSPPFKSLKIMLEALELTQLVEEPTRRTDTRASLIDLILVSKGCPVIASGVISCNLSDHYGIYCCLSIDTPNVVNGTNDCCIL